MKLEQGRSLQKSFKKARPILVDIHKSIKNKRKMKFFSAGSFLLVLVAVLCVSVTQSAPRPSNSSKDDGIKTGESVKRAANMAGVPFFEVHDLTGVNHDDIPDDVIPFEIVNIQGHTHETLPADIIPVEVIQPVADAEVFEVHDLTGVNHDDIPDDVMPFEIVNIDGHTHETLPADIIPVEVIEPVSDAEVFEVHNLDGVDNDDIPDDLSVFEVVDITGHTIDTLPDDVFPVQITPIGSVSAVASAFSTDGSAVSSSASVSSSGTLPAGISTRPTAGMSRVQVVPSYINRMKSFPNKSAAVSHVAPAPAVVNTRHYYADGHQRKVKCRQDLFPFRGQAIGMFKFFSDIVREELSNC